MQQWPSHLNMMLTQASVQIIITDSNRKSGPLLLLHAQILMRAPTGAAHQNCIASIWLALFGCELKCIGTCLHAILVARYRKSGVIRLKFARSGATSIFSPYPKSLCADPMRALSAWFLATPCVLGASGIITGRNAGALLPSLTLILAPCQPPPP